jgi:hypothetical protein
MKLSQLAMLCMLSTIVLDNFLPEQDSQLEMSLGTGTLLALVLVILPGAGAVLGLMSWRRERQSGWTIAIIVMSILLVLLGLVRLFSSLLPG